MISFRWCFNILVTAVLAIEQSSASIPTRSTIAYAFTGNNPKSAFQTFFNFKPKQQTNVVGSSQTQMQLEDQLLDTINNNSKRLDNSGEINSLVEQLEVIKGISRPAISKEIKGRWRLLHTSNADTASPIQRKAVDASKYNIYQDILIRDSDSDDENGQRLIVSQVVKFGDNSQLCVDALASTSEYPLKELTAREGTGKILGLNILGVSKVGEEAMEDMENPDRRIDFVFDEGNFDFSGLKIPYPVPFRLPIFRDAVKGWIDVTYLSERIRISRGNKGTTFVLLKEEDTE